jgi:hypothetical protein
MPNDAKLGLFVGVVVVIALAVIYHGKGPEPAPEAAVQAPKPLATSAQPNASTKPKEIKPAWPSFPGGDEAQVDKLGGKENSAQGVNREPDTSNQKQNEKS